MSGQYGKETNNEDGLMQVLAPLYRGMRQSPSNICAFMQIGGKRPLPKRTFLEYSLLILRSIDEACTAIGWHLSFPVKARNVLSCTSSRLTDHCIGQHHHYFRRMT